MRNISFLLFFLILFFASAAIADTFPSDKDLKPFTDKIMEQVIKGDIKKAFNIMKPYIVITEAELQTAAEKSISQREQFTERYGAAAGYEFISQKAAGESLIRLIYIEKLEKQPMIWAFYFYKAKTGWVLNSFVWDDQMQYLFQ